MASRTSITLFLALNLLFVTYTTSANTCPKDSLKLGVCANVLKIVGVSLESQRVRPCCSLVEGLADFEAAACLCTMLKANVVGIIKLKLPIYLNVILNVCDRKAAEGFQCV